jgi:hypothetical protein
MQLFLLCAVILSVFSGVLGQIPCDDAYGANCPEASGYEVGECLKKVDQSSLSDECKNYIVWHDMCREDIETHCTGKEYTGDALGIRTFLSCDSVYLAFAGSSVYAGVD